MHAGRGDGITRCLDAARRKPRALDRVRATLHQEHPEGDAISREIEAARKRCGGLPARR